MATKFSNASVLWLGALIDCMVGRPIESREGMTMESFLHPWVGRLTEASKCLTAIPSRSVSFAYAGYELLWYLSGHSKVDRVLEYAPQFGRWAEEGGVFEGGYGHRLGDQQIGYAQRYETGPSNMLEGVVPVPPNQLEGVIKLLQLRPNTRQAVLTIWDSGDLARAIPGTAKNVPCAISMQFLIRDGLLHSVASMRSQDAWLGMPYDVWSFGALTCLVAGAVGLKPGSYSHCCTSLHLYDKHIKKAENALSGITWDHELGADEAGYSPEAFQHNADLWWEGYSWPHKPQREAQALLETEALLGTPKALAEPEVMAEAILCHPCTLLRDCLAMCAVGRWGFNPELIANPEIRELVTR